MKGKVLPLAIMAVAALAFSCGGDDDSTGTKDSTPPAAIADLAVTEVTATSVTLSWTAPGDDGMTGTATTYDIRYATSTITAADWDSATVVAGEPTPQAAGTTQTMEITLPVTRSRTTLEASGSGVDDVYYFAIKTADEAENWSALSNVVSGELVEPATPAAVTDLTCTDSLGESMTMTWTAPGNDGTEGTAAAYDLRYAADPITEATWDAATPVTGLAAPQAAGTAETFVFDDVTWWQTHHWALRTQSDTEDWSGISNIPRATPIPPDGWRLLLRTRDGLLSCDFSGTTAVFQPGNYPLETVGDRVFVGVWSSGIFEYDATGTEIRTTPIPENVYYSDFTPLPGDRFALTNNSTDSVYVIDHDGNLLAADGLLEAPGEVSQMLDGVVVGNTLIICEDGTNNLLQMDCTTYELTLFKDLTALSGWLGTIDYYGGLYYMTQSQKVHSFTATGDPGLLYEFPEGVYNLTGIVVAGGYAFVCLNFEGALYRINVKTGEAVLVTDELNYPQDIALLRD